MPKYRATVQVSGLTGENPRAVRSALDEQLRHMGLPNCRVVNFDVDAPMAPRRYLQASASGPASRQIEPGALFLVAAAAWAVWFFWMMLSSGAD